MNASSNQPMMADPDYPTPQGAFPVWSKVFTKPSEQTFVEITSHPDAKAKAAYIWVFIAGTLSGLINSLTQFVVALAGLQQAAPELGQIPGMSGMMGVGGLLSAICLAPITGLFSVLGFMLSSGIIHGTAKFFGGEGSFDKMAYAFGAIAVPVSIISALMIPLNAVPFLVLCTLPVLVIVSLYALYLNIAAVKAVHQFGWGAAAGAVLMPTILILLLCGFLFLLLMRLAGPSMNDFLQQLQQTMPQP